MASDWVEGQVEPVARALCRSRGIDPDQEGDLTFEEGLSRRRGAAPPAWHLYRGQAREFLVMLEAAIEMDRSKAEDGEEE